MPRRLPFGGFWRVGALLSALTLQACFDPKEVDPGPELVPLEIDANGMVASAKNPFGINGYWYAYGDQYGKPARCTEYGGHAPEDCSVVVTPAPLPSLDDFPNENGVMCTSGVPCTSPRWIRLKDTSTRPVAATTART